MRTSSLHAVQAQRVAILARHADDYCMEIAARTGPRRCADRALRRRRNVKARAAEAITSFVMLTWLREFALAPHTRLRSWPAQRGGIGGQLTDWTTLHPGSSPPAGIADQ